MGLTGPNPRCRRGGGLLSGGSRGESVFLPFPAFGFTVASFCLQRQPEPMKSFSHHIALTLCGLGFGALPSS